MTLLKLLRNFGLILLITTIVSPTTIDYRLPNNVVPLHYNIKLIPHIEEDDFTFNGESKIDIFILRTTRNISLHILDLTLDEETTTLKNYNGISYTPVAHIYNNITQILVLKFDEVLPPGLHNLKIKFVGIVNNHIQGIFRKSYKNEEGNTMSVIATHFEATSARRAFPCWDEPALKATFNISIKHHKNYTALSNMPVVKMQVDDNNDNMLWTHFKTTPIMSTYVVAFVVADFVHVSNENKTINLWCRSELTPHVTFILEVTTKSEQLMTQYTNRLNDVPKMDYVAIPGFGSAMENWGLIFYDEMFFAHNEESDTTSQKHLVALITAHEIAHQWFGNLVSPSWWSNLWLKEGFASFFEEYIVNELFEDWREIDLFVMNYQQSAFRPDIDRNMMPIAKEVNSPSEIGSLYSNFNYRKAPITLRMLQHILTKDVFRNGIRKYLNSHQFISVYPNDLWSSLQAALDESEVPHDEYKLKDVMDTWMKQRFYPVVMVVRNYDTNEMLLVQRPLSFYMQIEDKNTMAFDEWWIPLSFTTQTNHNFSNTLPTHWLKPQDRNLIISGIDPDDWVIFNIQQTGNYIVNYDPKNWEKISNYLNSDEYTKIHVLNRAQIISDAFYLLVGNLIHSDMFLNLIKYTSRETDYIVWYPIFSVCEIMVDFVKSEDMENLKEHLTNILSEFIKKIGYEEDPADNDFTKLTRIKVLQWACIYDNSECKQTALDKLQKHLVNPETHKISPNLKDWTYCTGMAKANTSTWNQLWNVYNINSTNNMILDYLTCSEDPDILTDFLKLSENDPIIRDTDYHRILNSIITKHASNNVILDYILTKLEDSKSFRGIDGKETLSFVINNLHSVEQLKKVEVFMLDNYNEEEKITFNEKLNQRKLYVNKKKSMYNYAIV